MENFAQDWVYSLVLSGHIPTKNLAKSLPFRRVEFFNTNIKYFCNIISWHAGFLPGISFRGTQYLLFSDQVLNRAKSPRGTKSLRGHPLPIVEERHLRFNLSIQSFCPVAFTYHILQFCLFLKDCFTSLVPDIFGILANLDHHVHTEVMNWNLQILCCFLPLP